MIGLFRDQAQGFKMFLRKKKKKNEGIAQKNLKTNVLWLRVLNAAVAPSKKNADITLKNMALDVFYSPTYKMRLHVFSLSPVF